MEVVPEGYPIKRDAWNMPFMTDVGLQKDCSPLYSVKTTHSDCLQAETLM